MRRENTGVHRVRRGRKNRRTTSKIVIVTGVKKSMVRSLRRFVPLVLALLTIGGGVIGIHFGWQALRTSSRLQVREVEVRGAQRVGRSEVEAYTSITIGDSVAAFCPGCVFGQSERHCQQVLAVVVSRLGKRQVDLLALLWRDVQTAKLARVHRFAVLSQQPRRLEPIQIGEVVLVENANST